MIITDLYNLFFNFLLLFFVGCSQITQLVFEVFDPLFKGVDCVLEVMVFLLEVFDVLFQVLDLVCFGEDVLLESSILIKELLEGGLMLFNLLYCS